MIEESIEQARKQINELSFSVQSVKNDISKVGSLVDRLDTAILKLTDVSTHVGQLLAIQGNRLEFYEKQTGQIEQQIKQNQNNYIAIQEKINRVEKDHDANMRNADQKLNQELKDIHEKLEEKLDDITTLVSENYEKQNERISRIEKWMWILMGGLTVSTFLIKAIPWSSII